MVAEFKLSDAQVIPACNTDDTSFAEVCNSNANTNTVQIQFTQTHHSAMKVNDTQRQRWVIAACNTQLMHRWKKYK